MKLLEPSLVLMCTLLVSCNGPPSTSTPLVKVPTASPVATATVQDAPAPAPTASGLKLPEGSYLAAVVTGTNRTTVRFASWGVSAEGQVRSTEQTTSALEVDEAEPSLDVRISLEELECESPFDVEEVCPSGGCRSMAAILGRLTLPGEREGPIRLQWYGDRSEPRSSCVLASVDEGAPYAVVLDTILRSPAGPWLAPALGDLDGDGKVDVVFVAMGVGTCGGEATAECPVLWVDALLSSMGAVWETEARGTIARNAELGRMTAKLGEDPCLDSVRWVGKIESGVFVVEAIGPKGSLAWTMSRRGSQLSVRNR